MSAVRSLTVPRRARPALSTAEQAGAETLRALVENSPDAILLVAEDATVRLQTPAADRMLGYAPGSRVGRSAFDIVHPEDLACVQEAFVRCLARPGRKLTAEFRALRADGGWAVLEATAVNRLNERGLEAVVVNYRDVTDRYEAERRLRESEGRLRSAMEAALDAVVSIAEDGRVTYWNPRAEALFGWTAAEALGQPLADLVVPERDRAAHAAGLERLRTAGSGSGRLLGRRLEMTARKRDGSELPVELAVAAQEWEGRREYTAFIADISRRKQAEAQVRLWAELVRGMPLGVHVWRLEDPENAASFRLVAVNPAAEALTGVGEGGVGASVVEVVPHLVSLGLPERCREALLAGRDLDLGQIRCAGERGGGPVLASRAVPLPDRCVGVLFEDVSARLALEEQLRHAQKMDAVGRLAGGVAHDFNNLLGVIIGYADLVLRRLAADDPCRPRVEEIRRAGDRASGLTRQLLAFSRKQVVAPQVLDLRAVVSNLTDMLRRLIGEDVTLVTTLGSEPATVKADPGQLEQVLVNLAVNSREAMPGGGRLVIEVGQAELEDAYVQRHPEARAGRFVTLAVSDTGPGMDAETRRRIFEPFFTTKEHGTGLGLATTYAIVEQSNGFIQVESEPGRGAMFAVYLPAFQGAAARPAPRDCSPPLRAGRETILVVEDEPLLREVAREVLATSGYTVLVADGPAAALRLAERHHVDLLFTDVVMPGTTGPALAAQLTARDPRLKVLYTSGYTPDDVLQRGVLAEEMAFLQKPFTPEALARAVRAVLGSATG